MAVTLIFSPSPRTIPMSSFESHRNIENFSAPCIFLLSLLAYESLLYLAHKHALKSVSPHLNHSKLHDFRYGHRGRRRQVPGCPPLAAHLLEPGTVTAYSRCILHIVCPNPQARDERAYRVSEEDRGRQTNTAERYCVLFLFYI